MKALEAFKIGNVNYLMTTDLVGRGIDISGVETVINYHMPRGCDIKKYIHRVGRTARAGRNGVSVSFVSEGDRKLMKEVAKRTLKNVHMLYIFLFFYFFF